MTKDPRNFDIGFHADALRGLVVLVGPERLHHALLAVCEATKKSVARYTAFVERMASGGVSLSDQELTEAVSVLIIQAGYWSISKRLYEDVDKLPPESRASMGWPPA